MAMYILHKSGVNLIGAVTRDTSTVVNDPFTEGDSVSVCDEYSWCVEKNKESAHDI